MYSSSKFKFYIFSHARQPINEIVHRINWCKSNLVLPYVMRYDDCYTSKNRNFYTDMAAWCNQPHIFKKMTFEQFVTKRHKGNYKRYGKGIKLFESHTTSSNETAGLFNYDEAEARS